MRNAIRIILAIAAFAIATSLQAQDKEPSYTPGRTLQVELGDIKCKSTDFINYKKRSHIDSVSLHFDGARAKYLTQEFYAPVVYHRADEGVFQVELKATNMDKLVLHYQHDTGAFLGAVLTRHYYNAEKKGYISFVTEIEKR